ncbi:MAG TPA: glycerophosphodiester phosphodiesterase [Acidimicrobiia bacterium]
MSSEISVIGHRGMPTKFPDNSLPGFVAAARICDRVELDIRRSLDGKLVLSHDPTIGGLSVNDTPWSVLAEIDLGQGVKPCLFDEALAALPDTPVLIEVKNSPADPGYEADSRLALEAASRTRPFDAIISFNWESVERVRHYFPDVATGLNVGGLGDLGDAVSRCLDGGHRYLVPDVDLLMTAGGVAPPGVETFVWSSQRFHDFASGLDELVSFGVSGIITDDPESTRALIRSLP